MDYGKIIELVKQCKSIVLSKELRGSVDMKGDADFVTAVDTGISSFLKEELYKIDPNVGFFSEEEDGELSDPCWILDPIDGTTNLVYGYNMSSVSLALYKGGRVVFGVVYNPFNGECFTAETGKGAWRDGVRISVSDRETAQSIIEFGAGSTHKELADRNFEIAKEIFKNCIDIRRICSSALDLCFIADGRIDGYFEEVLKPWDVAAGSLILTEAGGAITDYDGAPIDFSRPTSVVAGNGKTNGFLLDTLKKYR